MGTMTSAPLPRASARIPAPAAARPTREAWFPMRSLSHALILAALVIAALCGLVFFRWGGARYYRTPVRVRGYTPWHAALRPSGSVGLVLGIAGFAVMTLTLLYVIRKKLGGRRRLGSMKGWLEFHIFCGVVGPALITLHSSFKFSGVISVAYWSMVLVVLSGFVGRYLFVRIPKTIRGTELTLSEIQERIDELRDAIAAAGVPPEALAPIEDPGAGGWLRWRRVRSRLRKAGVSAELTRETLRLARERQTLMRRIAQLSRTKKLFELWHVFHKPLVWVMFAIAAVHIALAVYFGYSIPRR